MDTPISVEIIFHKLQKFMQIKLEKYFIIIRSATVGLHQWEREEEHLDHIKRIASVRGRGEPIVVSERVWNMLPCFSAHQSGALNFSNLSPFFVCHAWPIMRIYLEPYHYYEEHRRGAQAKRMQSEQ